MSILTIIPRIIQRSVRFGKDKGMKSLLLKGSLWVGLGGTVERLLRFARNVILVRILTPEMFGVMAFVLSINYFFESFTEVGIKQSIIQNKKGEETEYLNSVWWVSNIRSLFLFVAAFAASPLVADFFKSPTYDVSELTLFLRISFVMVLFNGLMSPAAYTQVKKMDFKKWTIIFSGGGLAGLVISIALAFILKNVWALIIGFIAQGLFRVLLSYIFCPFMPRLSISREYTRQIMKFASGMAGLPILFFIFFNADVFVIKKMMSDGELGLYSMAAMLARMPLQFVSVLIDKLFLPAFSMIQDDNGKINSAVVKSISLILFIGFPVTAFLVFFGTETLGIFYGNRYAAAAVPFCVLFLAELLRVSLVPISTAYIAIGQPSLNRNFSILRAVMMLLLIVPAVWWGGLAGASLSVLVSLVISIFPQLINFRRLSGFKLKSYFAVNAKAILASLPVLVIGFIVSSLHLSKYLSFGIGVFSLLCVYAVIVCCIPEVRRLIKK